MTLSRTTVVNVWLAESDICVEAPSKWANPFAGEHDSTREQIVAQYREWIVGRPDLPAALVELRGKRLGCSCAPLACHGDVLAELANALPEVLADHGRLEQ